ncbi:hypothetical protein C8Q80DRAFT_889878 [Daedaleopsis nitida]|nr:hypothetical protein C8Q80DRAFT_889878 [Daedaleopsis nitida]
MDAIGGGRHIESRRSRGRTAGDAIPAQVSEKIRRCCEVARAHGFERVWVDSCCIDQASSSELSEAVNSMYLWYHHAKVCYAYLADVADDDDPRARGSQFRKSRWWTRGWTLQELIAPRVLVFLSYGWRVLGTKAMFAAVIEEVTGIDRAILTHEAPLESVSVAMRISWAARRQTSREEDQAYSLMGILNVHMPTIYGEGRFAFVRLQEEVLKLTSDQSLFAWGPTLSDNVQLEDDPSVPIQGHEEHEDHITDLAYVWEKSEAVWESPYMRNLFALSPRDFSSSGRVSALSRDVFLERLQITCPLPEYTVTSYGIRTTVPLITARSSHSGEIVHLAILACQDEAGRLLALILRNQEQTLSEYFVGAFLSPTMTIEENEAAIEIGRDLFLGELYFRTTHLSASFIAAHRNSIRTQEVYIPHRPSRARAQVFQGYIDTYLALTRCEGPFELHLAGWCKPLLEKAGFVISPLIHDELDIIGDPRKHGFVIWKGDRVFKIEVDACGCEAGHRHRWMRVVITTPRSAAQDSLSFDQPHPSPSRTFIMRHVRDHPDHVYSWTFSAGLASRQIYAIFADGERLTMQLTLTLATSGPVPHFERAYTLGVEMVLPAHGRKEQLPATSLSQHDRWVPPITVVDLHREVRCQDSYPITS